MNRFIIGYTPKEIAVSLCDSHVRKMILEESQMLSTALRFYNMSLGDRLGLYEITHVNHPCALWVRKTSGNFNFGVSLLEEMCAEYTHRYYKVHACQKFVNIFRFYSYLIPGGEITSHPQSFGSYTHLQSKEYWPVVAYRRYYRIAKAHLAKWTNRQSPKWY